MATTYKVQNLIYFRLMIHLPQYFRMQNIYLKSGHVILSHYSFAVKDVLLYKIIEII